MRRTTLRDLYLDELKELYSAEHQLVGILPRIARAATSPLLAKAILHHASQTERQFDRLEELFREIEVNPHGKACSVMKKLLDECREIMREEIDARVKDTALLATLKRIEHFEIAGYECTRTLAKLLGYERASQSLQETLDEEKAADVKLTRMAEAVIQSEVPVPQTHSPALELFIFRSSDD